MTCGDRIPILSEKDVTNYKSYITFKVVVFAPL